MDGVLAARRKAEVEIRQVDDAKPVKLRRQAWESHVQRAEPNPAGLELAPGNGGETNRSKYGKRSLHELLLLSKTWNSLGRLGVMTTCV